VNVRHRSRRPFAVERSVAKTTIARLARSVTPPGAPSRDPPGSPGSPVPSRRRAPRR
jgi:hypothetical protein